MRKYWLAGWLAGWLNRMATNINISTLSHQLLLSGAGCKILITVNSRAHSAYAIARMCSIVGESVFFFLMYVKLCVPHNVYSVSLVQVNDLRPMTKIR